MIALDTLGEVPPTIAMFVENDVIQMDAVQHRKGQQNQSKNGSHITSGIRTQIKRSEAVETT